MARTAKERKALTIPTEIPDGLEIVTLDVTLESAKRDKEGNIESGADRSHSVEILVPRDDKSAGSGIVALQKMIGDAGGNGNTFVARAIRAAIAKDATGVVKGIDSNNKDETKTKKSMISRFELVPSAPKIRVLDKAEAAGENLGKAVTEALRSGKQMSAADLLALYQAATGAKAETDSAKKEAPAKK